MNGDHVPCPVCKKETRHFAVDAARPAEFLREIYCSECRVLRVQFRQSDGSWI